MRRGLAIGLIVLLLALAVSLLLSARRTAQIAPALAPASPATAHSDAPGNGNAGEVSDLPDLDEMQRATDQHTRDVERALGHDEE